MHRRLQIWLPPFIIWVAVAFLWLPKLSGQDKAPSSIVRFPVPKPSAAVVEPTKEPAKREPAKLGADEIYVAETDHDCILYDSPADAFLKVTELTGPITIRARFAVDGNGDYETRTYKGKVVWLIEAAATGRAEIIIHKQGEKDKGKAFRRTIDANKGPRPPPEPEPKPDPKPSPAPIPEPGFRVLIIENTKARTKLPAEQQITLGSEELANYLDSKCVTGPDGKTKDWRIWPHDSPTASMSKIWSDAIKRQPTDTAKLPWIIISDGKTGFEGLLPIKREDTMKLLRKWGG